MAIIINIVLNLFSGFFTLTGRAAFILCIISYIVSYLAAFVHLVMTPWDFLVWLFNTNWRTTDFQASLVSLIISVAAGLVARIFDLITLFAENAESWCDRHRVSM